MNEGSLCCWLPARGGRVRFIVAKFRKLGGKVSLTEKIHTSSKNRNYIHQMVLSLWNHWQSKNSISSKGFVAKTTKNDIASFLLESSQDSLVQNQDGFRQPHLQTYFHGNYTYHPLFKDQHLAFPASYTPETWLFSYILPHNWKLIWSHCLNHTQNLSPIGPTVPEI